MASKLTRFIWMVGGILFGSVSANAACGPAFNGVWETRIIQSQGQYTQSNFISNASNGALHASTETGTRLSSDRRVIYDTIFALSYNAAYGNLSAKRLKKETCIVSFKRPRVDKDTYGVAANVVARQATLSVVGRSITWCWLEKGHMLGDCIMYRRND